MPCNVDDDVRVAVSKLPVTAATDIPEIAVPITTAPTAVKHPSMLKFANAADVPVTAVVIVTGS
jgi:hypothetical protein